MRSVAAELAVTLTKECYTAEEDNSKLASMFLPTLVNQLEYVQANETGEERSEQS